MLRIFEIRPGNYIYFGVYNSKVEAKNKNIISHRSALHRALELFVGCEELAIDDHEVDDEGVDAALVACELVPVARGSVPNEVGDEDVPVSDPPPSEAETLPFIAAQYWSTM